MPGGFRLDIRKNLFSVNGDALEQAAHRVGGVTIPGNTFKKCGDMVVRDMVSGRAGGGLMIRIDDHGDLFHPECRNEPHNFHLMSENHRDLKKEISVFRPHSKFTGLAFPGSGFA